MIKYKHQTLMLSYIPTPANDKRRMQGLQLFQKVEDKHD